MTLTHDQIDLINAPLHSSILLSGDAGTGKSTAAALRLQHMVKSGVPGESILVLVPQRSLAGSYYDQVLSTEFPSGGQPVILTFNGLTQRMITLFWPLIAETAGFRSAKKPFKFLTIETAQYHLAKMVEPLIGQGYFESLTLDPNRLYSQILDNLNKSAIVGFPPSEIADRLTQAWVGKPAQANIYKQAQDCALLFRDFCLAHNLLDFSLQLTLFTQFLWPSLICKEYIRKNYQHLIYDNIEEDYPVAHDFVRELLPDLESALLIQDTDGGFRSFLGADPVSASNLGSECTGKLRFTQSFVTSGEIREFQNALKVSILHRRFDDKDIKLSPRSHSIHAFRFYPEVIDWAISEIRALIDEHHVPPGEIAVLTPYLSDALRFAFSARFNSSTIPFTTYRPSRSLYNEPAVKTILTLVKLAHPSWGLQTSSHEIRTAFAYAIQACDYTRGDLIARSLVRKNNKQWVMNPFDQLIPDMQERITFTVGEYYESIRNWFQTNQESAANDLDHWISRLFGELLSQKGYGYHDDFDAAASISHLIDSCRKFRTIFVTDKPDPGINPGQEYVRVLEKGILAAQSYLSLSEQESTDAVFLGPAFSFLMRNKPVTYQFWLDIGSQGWWARLDQPLTQPYVLNRNWQHGKQWTDVEEFENNQKTLARITNGLLHHCREHVYLCSISLNERGLEERGQLMLALQTIRRIQARQNAADIV